MKQRRTWTPPAAPPPGRPAPSPPGQAPTDDSIQLLSPPGSVREYLGRTMVYAIFFGVIAGLFQSRFPLALGAFLFVADERFIAWTLAKIGVRFIPDSLGLAFIDTFVFFAGAWILITTWKESAPAWLLPPVGSPWLPIAITAFACAVINSLSAMTVKKLLPRLGIALTPNGQSAAEFGLVAFALIACAAILQWF